MGTTSSSPSYIDECILKFRAIKNNISPKTHKAIIEGKIYADDYTKFDLALKEVFHNQIKMGLLIIYCCEEIGVCHAEHKYFLRFLRGPVNRRGKTHMSPWCPVRKSLQKLYIWLCENSGEQLVENPSYITPS